MKSVQETKAYLSEVKDDLLILRSMEPKEMYTYLIDKGAELQDFPDKSKNDENKIKGCTSTVYLTTEIQEGRITFRGWADALIVRGYLAILITALSGLVADDIDETKTLIHSFAKEINIESMLTTSRANAFSNIYKEMCRQASLYLTK